MKRDYKIVKQDRKGLDAVRRPTAIEIAWAAGIYEGEGSCVATRTSFGVSVSQKDPELLYRLRDLFGGNVSHYNNRIFNKKICPISHWNISGDRGRTFIGAIYPFLTARRKEQIDATSAGHFIELAQDLIRFDVMFGQSQVYDSLWTRIYEYDAQQRQKALEHKKKYQKEHWAKRSANPEVRAHRKQQRQERKKLKKEQLQVQATKLVAIA
jgi:hypothetical protein